MSKQLGEQNVLYSVDSQDRLVVLESIPPCSVGAPLPCIVGTEHYTALCYIAAQPPPEGWHGQYATIVDHNTSDRSVIIVEFHDCADVRFGWFPDENTCRKHPLASRGLEPYSAFEVANSSWVRRLTELESGNRDNSLSSKRHFIFTFHDTSCECVADSYVVRSFDGSIQSALADVVESLDDS